MITGGNCQLPLDFVGTMMDHGAGPCYNDQVLSYEIGLSKSEDYFLL